MQLKRKAPPSKRPRSIGTPPVRRVVKNVSSKKATPVGSNYSNNKMVAVKDGVTGNTTSSTKPSTTVRTPPKYSTGNEYTTRPASGKKIMGIHKSEWQKMYENKQLCATGATLTIARKRVKEQRPHGLAVTPSLRMLSKAKQERVFSYVPYRAYGIMQTYTDTEECRAFLNSLDDKDKIVRWTRSVNGDKKLHKIGEITVGALRKRYGTAVNAVTDEQQMNFYGAMRYTVKFIVYKDNE